MWASLSFGSARPAAAQAGPGPTSTTTSTTTGPAPVDPGPATTSNATTSTTTPSPGASVSPTTVPPTTVPPPAWTTDVPGPPAPEPVTATPAELARANQLERQIATQSAVLDVLAEQFDAAQQKVQATAAQLTAIQANLAAAQAGETRASEAVGQAQRTLRAIAVDAYIGLGGAAPPNGPVAMLATYARGSAVSVAQTAIGKALNQVQELRQAGLHLKAAREVISEQERQAAAASGAAQTAAAQAQAAAQATTGQQQELLTTVSQVSGNLVQLVASARAAQAQAAFNRFAVAGVLDFPTVGLVAGPSIQAGTAVQAALAQVGKPYVWGATGPDAFDCSGLVQWAWARAGVALPRVAADQQAWAIHIPISQLAPGDLVFFGNPAHHVGIYVGGGRMVDAPHTGANVSVVPIWWESLAGFGRVH